MSERHDHKHLRLYVMRHGEIESGPDAILYGQMDVALSVRGWEQSQWLCRMLTTVPLVAVYSSDLGRARGTADLIVREHEVDVMSLPALREISMGEWEGRSLTELNAAHPEMVAQLFDNPRAFQYPSGESFAAFEHRVQGALQTILATHESGGIAVVTHGGVCRVILGHVLELAPQHWLRLAQDFGCLNIIDWYDRVPLLRRLNHTSAEIPDSN